MKWEITIMIKGVCTIIQRFFIFSLLIIGGCSQSPTILSNILPKTFPEKDTFTEKLESLNPAKFDDRTKVPLGGDLTLDLTSVRTQDDGLIAVMGGSNKKKNVRLLYVVNCQKKSFALSATNHSGGEGQWLPSKKEKPRTNPAFAALVCN
jgi:hypothetical protein